MTDNIHSCSPFCTLPACVEGRTRQEFEAWLNSSKAVNGYDSDLFQAWQTATERATASQWQPIETAPKDESVIILGYPPHHRMDRLVYEGRWHSDQLTWTSVNGFLVHNSATHWMPLPPPPAIRQGGAE